MLNDQSVYIYLLKKTRLIRYNNIDVRVTIVRKQEQFFLGLRYVREL